jgi:hypothetical protein
MLNAMFAEAMSKYGVTKTWARAPNAALNGNDLTKTVRVWTTANSLTNAEA